MSTGGLSLDNYFRKPFFPGFPYFKSEMQWSSYNLNDLSINLFGNFRSAQIYNNLKAYVGAPDYTDEEIQAYIDKAIKGVYYTVKDKNDQYDKNIDIKLADIRLFISLDGAFLLKAHHALKNNIKKDEIAIFLEIPEGDIVSGNVMAVAAGENARQYAEEILQHKWTQDQFTLDEGQVKDLISALNTGQSFWNKVNAIALGIMNKVDDAVTDLGIDAFKAIADFFGETLRIDEKSWNTGHPEYLLKNEIVVLLKERLRQIEDFFNSTLILPENYRKMINLPLTIADNIIQNIDKLEGDAQELWAFVSGLWNALMDLISGIFALIQLVFKAIKAHRNYSQNENYYNALTLEYIDNFLQALAKLDWISILINSWERYQNFNTYVKEVLPIEIWQELLGLNRSEASYYSGYITFNIIEFLLPPLKLTRLNKGAKVEKVVSALESVASKATHGKVPTVKASDEVAKTFFLLMDQFTEIARQGTQAVNKFIDDIFDALKKWVDEIIAKIRKEADDFVRKLPSKYAAFINALEQIPGLQRRIINGVLVCKFKGKNFLMVDPRGIITELKYFTEIFEATGNWKRGVISQIKDVTVELNIIDDTGKAVMKRYKDNVEVFVDNKNNQAFIGFRPVFKQGTQREADYINYTFSKTESWVDEAGDFTYATPPCAVKPRKNAIATDKILKENDEFYMVEFENRNQQPVPGAFAADYKPKNIQELRDKLQVLKEWKDEDRGTLVVRKYKVQKGYQLQVRESDIGHLKTGESTGVIQWEFLEKWDKDSFEEILFKVEEEILK